MSSSIKASALVGVLAAVAMVSAHGFVQNVVVDGTSYTGYLMTKYPYLSDPPASIGWAETATNLGFIAPDAYASGDIICHKNATNAQLSATVKAGGTVVMEWNTWPEAHKGPVIDYLANCNGDCSTVDKTTLEFFKIDEVGLITDSTSIPGTWASDQLIAANNSWSITIPSTIVAGNYVLRHEIIALWNASRSDSAQNYPQCINLEVTGGGSDVPAGTLGESLYTETEPGILVDIYTTGLTYTIPGPALYTGGSSGSASTSLVVVTSSGVQSAVPTTFVTSVPSSVEATPTVSEPIAVSSPSASAAANDDTCEL